MKLRITTLAISLTFVLVLMEGCSKSNTPAVQQNTPDLSVTVTSGSWTVSSWTQRGEDKSSSFTGYKFTFLGGGVLKAEQTGSIVNGSWSYKPSAVTYYGSTASKSSLTMNLGTSTPLVRLAKTWNVDSAATSSNKIVLVSPEVAEGEQLVFSKN